MLTCIKRGILHTYKLPLILLTLDQTSCLEQELQCLTLASHFVNMQNLDMQRRCSQSSAAKSLKTQQIWGPCNAPSQQVTLTGNVHEGASQVRVQGSCMVHKQSIWAHLIPRSNEEAQHAGVCIVYEALFKRCLRTWRGL